MLNANYCHRDAHWWQECSNFDTVQVFDIKFSVGAENSTHETLSCICIVESNRINLYQQSGAIYHVPLPFSVRAGTGLHKLRSPMVVMCVPTYVYTFRPVR